MPEIEGEFQDGEIVLVLDDLITGANTKMEGVEAIRNNSLIVTDCIVLVDCEQGGLEQYQKAQKMIIKC